MKYTKKLPTKEGYYWHLPDYAKQGSRPYKLTKLYIAKWRGEKPGLRVEGTNTQYDHAGYTFGEPDKTPKEIGGYWAFFAAELPEME